MSSGTYDFDERGRKLFRPTIPSFPPLEEVHDLLDPAMTALREFDRRLRARQETTASRDWFDGAIV